MNNKRGGVGAKIILVLILMLASAGGGAYGYSVLDGKLAVREANKIVASVNVADYDAPENTEIQGYIDKASKDLATAKTRKEVYEIMTDFNADVAKVPTKTQKELEEARRAAEEAKNSNNNNNNNNNGYNNGNNNGYNDNNNGYDNSNGYNNNNNSSNNPSNDYDNSYHNYYDNRKVKSY